MTARATHGVSRGLVFIAVAIAIVRSAPDPGPVALRTWLAEHVLAHGLLWGRASIGWLGALVLHAASHASTVGLAALSLAFAVGALALVERRARAAGATPRSGALAASLAALCTIDALQPGDGPATWCFAAFVMLALENPTLRNRIALGLATVLWCNVEPQGLLAPMLALAVAAGALFERPADAQIRNRAIAVGVALAACACTPAGIAFPQFAFDALRLGDAAAGIAAVVPAATAPHAYRFGLFVVLAVAVAFGSAIRARDAVPVALAFVLALASGALVPLFGIVAAPSVAAALRSVKIPAFAPAAVALVFVASLTIARLHPPSPAIVRGPFDLAARAAAIGGPNAILLCANVDWCDGAFAAGERVVMDGRIAPYDEPARAAQRSVVGVKRDWRAALARSGVTQVLARNDTALASLVAASGDWREIARDGTATLYGRRER